MDAPRGCCFFFGFFFGGGGGRDLPLRKATNSELHVSLYTLSTKVFHIIEPTEEKNTQNPLTSEPLSPGIYTCI